MDKEIISRRKELALTLLTALKNFNGQIDTAASEVEKNSGVFYEQAFKEQQDELLSVLDNYHKNVDKIRAIYDEITESINSWYEFIKDEKQTGKITFPITFLFKRHSLKKKITNLNEEISHITINNRFIKENLKLLEHKLNIKAVCLAKAGGNYLEYETTLLNQKSIIAELKYLLPTIPGICPTDIRAKGINKLITELEAGG